MIKIAVITVSDRCFQGEKEDKNGPAIKEIVKSLGEVVKYRIIPDEEKLISNVLKEMIDCHKVDIVLTTGGTGLSSRDVTPEATKEVVGKEMPGIILAGGKSRRMKKAQRIAYSVGYLSSIFI